MLHPVQYLHLRWDGNTFASQIPLWVNQQKKTMQSKRSVHLFQDQPAWRLSPIEVSTWNSEVLTKERQSRTRENLWVHTLGPLKSSKSDSETLITASDRIGMFKGPRVCTHRFSHILPFHLTLVSEWENLWVPGYVLQWETKTPKTRATQNDVQTWTLLSEFVCTAQLPMATQSAMYNRLKIFNK